MLSFEEIENGQWYIIPELYVGDEPARIYKTTYKKNSYIKSISNMNQQEIVKVPSDAKIFREPDDVDDMDDGGDFYDDSDENYLEDVAFSESYLFRTYNIHHIVNDILDLTDEEKLKLYKKFVKIEKKNQQ